MENEKFDEVRGENARTGKTVAGGKGDQL